MGNQPNRRSSRVDHTDPTYRQIHASIDAWKKSLLDLSRRNRLLYFGTGIATRVHITRPLPVDAYRTLALEEKSLDFPHLQGVAVADIELDEVPGQLIEPRVVPGHLDVDPAVTSKVELGRLFTKLERLRRGTRTIEEEQGVNTLFLALGLLEWREGDNTDEIVRSPLVLIPVRLERTKDQFVLKPHEDDVEVNPALAYRLEHDFRIALPSFGEFDGLAEDKPPDIPGYLHAVERSVGSRGWRVFEETWLAQFAFHKLAMYRDLEEPSVVEKTAVHEVLALLCGGSGIREALPVATDNGQPDRPEVFPVLDADSSQAEVLERVARGESLVVQGPPGTGKSQTIVNVIAQTLRQGKTVLFVSEKRAALEVVYERLRRIGLDELCLEMHHHKANRKSVVTELDRAINMLRNWRRGVRQHMFDEYVRAKADLDSYVSELHLPRDQQGRSVYRIHGLLAKLAVAPVVALSLPMESAHRLAPVREQELFSGIRAVTAAGAWDSQDRHPWRDAAAPADRVVIASVIGETAERLLRELGWVRERLTQIGHEWDIGVPGRAPEIDDLVRLLDHLAKMPETKIPIQALKDQAVLLRMVDLMTDGRNHQLAIHQGLASLRAINADDARIWNSKELVYRLYDRLEQVKHSGPIQRTVFQVQVTISLRKALVAKVPVRKATDVLHTLWGLFEASAWFERYDNELREHLGALYRDNDADFGYALSCATWIRNVWKIARGVPPAKLVDQVETAPADVRAKAAAWLPEMTEHAEALRRLLTNSPLASLFPSGIDGLALPDNPLCLLAQRAEAWTRETAQLSAWLQHQRAVARCTALGLDAFLSACEAQSVLSGQLGSAFQRAFLTRWLEEAYAQAPILAQFSRSSHEATASRFRELDRHLQREAVNATFAAVASHAPDVLPQNETMRIRREAAKRRRHKPLRRLMPEIPNVVRYVKPCFLMSPLSVAAYLPQDLFVFDLVVFDEASQLPPGDAVGCILRAKQVLIFGDNKQLPPTDFFQAHVDGEESDTEAVDFESILDIAWASLPQTMLTWHYRSLDERLIAFSNEHFYERRLTTFPAPRLDTTDTGVRFIHVPGGAFGRGGTRTNPVEAGRVADLVVDHLRERPSRSLGVVAMSIEQRDAIQGELQRRLRDQSELEALASEDRTESRPEPLFIKNLETVQGDERDEIIISFGYGPSEPGGPPTLQFGPLNRQGGERRWNVAITRARYRTTLVASLLPHQLDAARTMTRHDGPKIFAQYAAYSAGQGQQTREFGPSSGEAESPFEEAVRDALEGRGYEVDSQVGASGFRIDLAIRNPDQPNRYILGIECDGATYHRSSFARDRDRIRHEILSVLGWNLHRIWSTEWLRDPRSCLERIGQQIQELRAAATSIDPSPPGNMRHVRAPVKAEGGNADPIVTDEFMAVHPNVQFPHYRAYRSSARPNVPIPNERSHTLARLIKALVEAEGPVHEQVAFERLRDIYGHSRMGDRIVEALHAALQEATSSGWVVLRGSFLWDAHRDKATARSPSDGSLPRLPEFIAPEEWEDAVVQTLTQLGVSTSDELVRGVCSGFGYERVTQAPREMAGLAVERLLEKGKLSSREGLFNLER